MCISTQSLPFNSPSHHQCAASDSCRSAVMPGDEELGHAVVRSDPPPMRSDESTFVARMLESEPQHMPHPDYIRLCQTRSVYLISRQDSINSILKVHAHFGFKPVTAFLSVNYLDRFLSSHHTLMKTGWPFQLLSIACLSLAAKMEELNVPWLLDLQVLETRNVFQPKTIMRMELSVLTTLKWRLRSVTPFNYLHYFISMLPSSSDSVSSIHTFASDIIVNTTRVIDFTGYPPSAIAAAAVISASGQGLTLPDTYDERINREMVRSCHQLIEEYMLDTCPCQSLKAISAEPDAPPSPMGVLDAAACPSCHTHSENPSSASGPGSGEADRENKRLRLSTPDVHEL